MRRLVYPLIISRSLASFSVKYVAENAGFPLEVHKATTEDGYVLTMHRINDNNRPSQKPPILLQHGLWSSSDDWVAPGPEKSLGFLLARNGFDVWLGNTRGNYYSRQHVKLSPETDSKDFWDFSWHEMGLYDLPAMVDYILEETGRKQLYYIGHSQGTTAFFVMAAKKPDYNTKVKAMFAFAPVAYLRHMRNRFLKSLAVYSDPLLKILKSTGNYKILPQEGMVSLFNTLWTRNQETAERVTNTTLKALSFYAAEEVKMNIKEIIVSRMNTGTPYKLLAHYAQCTQMDKGFRHFDYGPERNLEIYGQTEAPLYELGNISVPIIAFYSEYDWLTHSKDLELFVNSCNRNIILEKVNVPYFNHLDFIWSDCTKFDIFLKLNDYLNSYDK